MTTAQQDLEARLERLSPRQRELVERLAAQRAWRGGRLVPRPAGWNRVPASFDQERLWFMDQLVPHRIVYHVPLAFRIRGALDPAAVDWAFNQVIARHESLRTTFEEEAGRPIQVVHDALPIEVRVVDVSDADHPQDAARRCAAEDASEPFDLTTGPLTRARLYRMGPRDHVLLVTQHHIVSDFWSVGLLFQELQALYSARVAGDPSPLPALSLQYPDFALWQQEFLQGEALDRLVEYWRGHLAGAPDVVDLPADRPRPLERRGLGRFHPLRFDAAAIAGLRRLAQEEGATLLMALLAVFKGVLARSCRQPDVVVGVPITGRSRGEVQEVIGYFLNWLAIRTHVGDDPTFRELLRRVRDAAVGAYAHQELPFDRVVQAVQPARSLGSTPLFQVSLSLRDSQPVPPRLGGLDVSAFPLIGGGTHYDLMVELWAEDDTVTGGLPYNTDLFDEPTVARIGGHLRQLLAAAAAEPDRPISTLSMLAPEERRAVLAPWGAPEDAGERPPLHALFEERARRSPGAVAASCEGERLTYDELNRRANRLARALRGRGAGPEAIVAICTERSLDTVVAILAVLKAGAAYLPLDPDYPAERLAYMLRDARAIAVVAQPEAAGRLPDERPPTLLVDDDGLEALPDGNLDAPVDPSAAAYVIYTSGSTGAPKGTVVTHRNVTRLFATTRPWFDFGPEDVWTLFHSYAFDFSVWELWGALLHGGRLVVVPQWVSRAPDAFLDLIAEEGVTVLNQTPSAFRELSRLALERGPADLPLRLVVFGGEALDVESLRPWFDRFGDERPRLVNMYGITETTVHVTYRPLRRADLDRAGASVMGRPLPDLGAVVLDANLKPVPAGVPGELHVSGAGLSRGYLGRPDLTAERFVPDPHSGQPGARMYRTGDLAKLLPGGELVYLGRIDSQVKIRGHRIELGEVQAALTATPGVREAAVIAREERGDRRLVAYVVPDGPDAAGAGHLGRSLRSRLPEYMVPASFVEVDELPLTPNGKVDARRLPAPDGRRPEQERPYVAPRTPDERLVAEVWSEVLHVERVGATDNFFDLGGHSLMAVQVVGRLRARSGIGLPIAVLFQRSTVESLAAALAEPQDAGEPAVEAAGADDLVSSLSDDEVEALLSVADQAEEPRHA
ncbi:MAG TPA: amino acid adenylation domain-containing protein [Candidatus Dormibacteraeota bacterium]